ncbi:WecB/TagA/CpsF family glycosyltransferase [Glaciecola petra]|uniref:WecB/TagA/CpsF family glycosyltransferase n=1 Tax=Glaciecola petra TaxID=3075602 RepID=A0ABU2ZNX2_9ALTE|nr:WecB/TagA/CpsF family glycosyltransferase [Aestuariibacter sp. P117]MDT0593753.1 WecB/TagA/CpsF family glycosyltransferase [Aestuariibacter sp. P117]
MTCVSVIVNTYNGSNTVEETLNSITSQTFTDIEIIIWDDCSTDNTKDVISRIEDDRITLYQSDTNIGLGASRKAALRKAKGDWVAYLDQDDLWAPTHLEKIINKSKLGEYSFIYARTLRFYDSGDYIEYDHRHEYEPLPEGDIFLELFKNSCFIAIGSAVFKRKELLAIDDVPEQISACPDYYFYLRLAHNQQVGAVQEVGCYYRMFDGNMTMRWGVVMQTEILWLLDQWQRFIPPKLLNKRRKVHQSFKAYCLWRQDKKYKDALFTLLKNGSIFYFVSRPFVQYFRKLKRMVKLPWWRRDRNINVKLMKTKVSAYSFSHTIDTISDMVEKQQGGYVSCANAFGLTMAYEEKDYRDILNEANIVTTDGMPIVWTLRAMGVECERAHNDDLVLDCCERFDNWTQVLVGGREGQPEEVAEELRKRYPGIKILDCFPTPERPVSAEYTNQIIERINQLKPDVVWVALGTPAQDVWMSAVNGRISAPMVACGSLFDLLSGRTKPCPEWMKKSGLQWLYRLSLEPRRLFKRYAYYNSKYVLVAFLEIIKSRIKQKGIKFVE